MSKDLELLKELFMTAEFIGAPETINALRNARVCVTRDFQTQQIITIVCRAIGITVAQFRDYKFRDDKRKVAISMVVFFLHDEKYFDLTYRQITKVLPLGMSISSVINYYKIIDDANMEKPRSNIDMLIANHIKTVSQQISPLKITA